jgi:hypothetical protein
LIPVTLLWEEPNMVTLAGDDDNEGNVHVGVSSFQKSLHVRHLLLQNMGVLLLGNTVAECGRGSGLGQQSAPSAECSALACC